MILYASLVTFAMLYTLVRTGVFGFYVAVVPIFSLLAAYQFFTDKHALRDAGVSPDPATIGLLGLSGLDWVQIAAVAWIGLVICIFYIKKALVGKQGQFSHRLMCGPWF